MKIRGVLLGTLEEQVAGGDLQPIDPASCPLEPVGQSVNVNFRPDKLVGIVTRLWLEDGRVMFEAKLDPRIKETIGLPIHAVVGGTMIHPSLDPVRMIDLFAVGLTDTPVPVDQPRWRVVDDSKEKSP